MSAPTVLLAGYLVIAAAGVALTLGMRARDRAALGPLALLRVIMRRPAGRWLVLMLWLWVGWHFFVR
jgi:hypothetical protein